MNYCAECSVIEVTHPGQRCSGCAANEGLWDARDDEYDEDGADDDDLYAECYWCDGTGRDECNDPGCSCLTGHPCGSCGGSGLAKDMTIW